MAASRWMFTKEQLMNTPSRKCGIDADKELSYRQQAANLIQDMGQRLSVTQLCINTAIVYMHRFYMFRSFSRFPRNEMAPACLFLAAKVEEQPRKLEHVIKVAHSCLHRDNTPAPNVKTEAYLEQAQILVMNENVLLQTLGFEVTVDHPHTHVVKATQLVKASKDLAQTSYFLATNSLHLTALCLQFRPTIVACVCIYLACKWSNWKIPRSNEGKEWFQYVDRSVTAEMLEEVYQDFLRILEKCPHKLRKKIMGYKGGAGKDEEYQRSVNEQMRRPQAESSHFSASASQEANRPSSSSTQHKHLNHERKDSHDVSKEHHPDQRHSHDQRDSRGEFKKEWQHERKESHSDKKLSGDRKESSSNSDNKKDSHHQDLSKSLRKDGHSEKRDPHSDRKDALSTLHRKDLHLDKKESGEHRDRLESPHEKKDSAQFRIKTEPNSDVRSHSGSHPLTTAQPTSTKIESSSDNGSVIVESDQTCQQNTSSTSHTNISSSSEIRKVKSETALNYKVYLKRKEQEKLEKEKLHKQKVDSDNLNKTFSEGNERDRKHRPPKLDISLPVHGSGNHRQSHGQDRNERPYEVTCNIKSPIKPHYNITVKSPIKSSDLKQPKIEINKVQITPEKEGGDPFSVNINSDPNIKKIMENIKQEPGVSNLENAYTDQTDSPSLKIKIKSETSDSKLETRHERIDVSNVKIKYEQSDDLESEISLQPEHVTAPNFKIKELRYDPENGGLDSAASLRLAIKHDSISGHTTPVVSQCRSESGSGASTPIRLKIPLHTSGESSPLKLKISTKGLKAEHQHGSSKYHSPHRHHKDKHKHKSRKHSRDREKHRDKEKHKEKHGSSSTSSSGANGQPLKMSIKLSDIPGQSGSGAESWSVKSKHDKHRHKVSISDPALNRNNSAELERQQPWSMSDLISKSTSTREKSPSRKRRRTPTVDQNNDISSHPKTAKTDTTQQHHRIRRSSSSHSIVSMEMSDGEDTGQNNGPDLAVDHPKDKLVNQLQANLQQMIDQTKLKIQHQQYIQNKKKSSHSVSQESRRLDRQQSGFDLEGMMWAGNNSDPPPLPPGSAPPLPSTPAPRTVAPPPPPH